MKSRFVLYCVESRVMRWYSIKGKNKGKLLMQKAAPYRYGAARIIPSLDGSVIL